MIRKVIRTSFFLIILFFYACQEEEKSLPILGAKTIEANGGFIDTTYKQFPILYS